MIIECLKAFFAFVYTGRFANNMTIYEMELVKCLASCLGFKKLSTKFGNFTMMLQRQVKLTLAKDISSLE